MKELIEVFTVILAVVISGMISGIAIGSAVYYIDCAAFERATNISTKWDFGCYALADNGRWVPKEFIFGKAKEVRIKEVK